MSQGTNLGSQKGKWIILAALVAVLGALLFLLPGGLVQAQQNLQVVEYAENGKGPVITLSARDPEGVTPIVWSLPSATEDPDLNGDDNGPLNIADAADNGRFNISDSGVLSFNSPPNFEDESASNDANYQVVVQATDRGEMMHRNWFKVTVKVGDVEEPGKVTLSHLQPQVGVAITATVTDPDGPTTITDGEWKWFRSSNMTGPWEEITGGTATTLTYTPRDDADNDDRNKYLRAEATYDDARPPEYGKKEAEGFSAHQVSEARADNTAPSFRQTAVDRNIRENTAAGMKIGAPVSAMDSDSGDILVYALDTGNDAASFSIDRATGQLMTKGALNSDTNPSYTVMVTATDSSDEATDPMATVTISITDEDEPPAFPADAVTAKDIAESATGDALMVGTYTGTDPEGGVVALSLSGDDEDMFMLGSDTETGNAATHQLSFKEAPDFEAKADSDRNNVYEVTVEASDGSNVGKKDVMVKVTNTDEGGKVTLSGAQPVIGTEITATLADEDGFVPDTVMWTWHRLDVADADAAATEDNAIDKATSAMYTPVAADNDKYLKANASYADMTHDTIATVTSDASAKVSVDTENKRPVFDDGTSTERYVVEGTGARDIAGLVAAMDANMDSLVYTLGGTNKDSFTIVPATGQLMTKATLDHEKKNRYTVTVTADDSRGETNSTATITVTIHVTDMDEGPMISDRKDSTKTESQVVEYDENGKGPVITLSARDPEGVTPIVWSLPSATEDPDLNGDDNGPLNIADAADNGSFNISQGGVLSFNSPPNFEDESASNDANYQVVVQATDRGEMMHRNWFKVTVKVGDVEEPGKVTLSHLQPQVRVAITATVTDPDGPTTITDGEWKWFRSSNMTGPWEEITGGTATTLTYTPRDDADNDDRNKYLRAEATYDDARPPEYGKKGASGVSAHRVQAEQENNTAPSFRQTAVDRNIRENTAAGMKIGAPVSAMDSDSGDILVYALDTGNDAASFSIDRATGQLMTKGALNSDTNPSYTVMVTATDSSDEATDPVATVTISIDDIDEAPTFFPADAVTAKDIAEDATGDALMVGTYTGTDPEGGVVTLSLSGDDASKFELNDPDTVAAGSKVLALIEAPDFEAKADSDRNNVYEVTVEASDGTNVGKKNVTVKVINADENGMVTLSGSRPLIGVEITAILADEDGFVPDTVMWTWHRLDVADAAAAATEDADDDNAIDKATSAMYTPVAADNDKYLKAKASYADMTHDTIPTVTSAASAKVAVDPDNKRPEFDDGTSTERYVMEGTDPGMNIAGLVAAMDANMDSLVYTLGGTNKDSFTIVPTTGQLMTKATLDHEKKNRYTVTVKADDSRGEANSTATITVTIHVTDMDEMPEIFEGGLGISGPASVLSYTENGMDAVGTYTAVGPEAASARWTREGADAGDFMISRDGTLKFRSSPDYEDPMDADMDNTYMVTVKANDGTNMAMKEVTVTVTNVDELGRLSGPATASHMENSTDEVGTYMASGPDADMATWTLMGDDMGDLSISTSGVLTFDAPPNFEMPMDEGKDNTYMVTVKAEAGGEMDMVDVTVTVTNADDDGTVTLMPVSPSVDTEITATLIDEDIVTGNTVTWQWSRSLTMGGTYMDIDMATSMTYTPVPADVGYYLRATVMYTDGLGSGKMEMATTASMVTAADPLLAEYDTNKNGTIERSEVIAAINRYLDGEAGITRPEVIAVINRYLGS